MDGEVPGGAGRSSEPGGHRHQPRQQRRLRPAAPMALLRRPHALRRQPRLLLARR